VSGRVRARHTPLSLSLSLSLHPSPPCNFGTKRDVEAFDCQFWDVAASKWASTGCKLRPDDEEAARLNKTLCECSHLTDITLLMAPEGGCSKDLNQQLQWVVVGLLCAAIVFVTAFCVIFFAWKRRSESECGVGGGPRRGVSIEILRSPFVCF
jgi:hypothetical protein